jgi:hypothetical protein
MRRRTRDPRLLPAWLLAASTGTLLVAGLGWPAEAAAQDVQTAAVAPEPSREPVNLRMHAGIFIAGAATIATAGALQPQFAPASCRWCDLHPDGTDALNPLDRSMRNAFLWEHPNTASTVSDLLAFGALPTLAIGMSVCVSRAHGRGSDIKADMLVIGEAAVLAGNAAELLKLATARKRPYAHARALGQPVGVAQQSGDNLSFTSGHVAFAFSLTVSAAEVMALRGQRRAATWLWAIGLPAAVSVGYFRIAADRHYLTDVLASVGVGTAMGLTIPRLVFKGRPSGWAPRGRVTVAPVASGSIVGITCVW